MPCSEVVGFHSEFEIDNWLMSIDSFAGAEVARLGYGGSQIVPGSTPGVAPDDGWSAAILGDTVLPFATESVPLLDEESSIIMQYLLGKPNCGTYPLYIWCHVINATSIEVSISTDGLTWVDALQ
jgi:hypothetical protein